MDGGNGDKVVVATVFDDELPMLHLRSILWMQAVVSFDYFLLLPAPPLFRYFGSDVRSPVLHVHV